jgi:hypothetical protein
LSRAGDHAANLKRAIANAEKHAAKEQVHFDDKKKSRRSTRPASQRGRRQILLGIAAPKKRERGHLKARASKNLQNPSAGSAETRLTATTAAALAAGPASRTATGAAHHARLHWEQAFALHLLSSELAGPADRFRLFPRFLFGGFFVMAAEFHLAENALALHLLLERFEGLVDVIVANENLHACSFVMARTGFTQNHAMT